LNKVDGTVDDSRAVYKIIYLMQINTATGEDLTIVKVSKVKSVGL